MNRVLNIPQHKNCKNCGECCGVIPASVSEVNAIRDYIAINGINPVKHAEKGICPFRDNENKKCLIYSVRPIICRLFGVCQGMECPNGNTVEIDGNKFLNTNEPVLILNMIEW